MQENEFEKNLQQKMQALQVQPSEESWQKIKIEVAEKKRRRRGVVFFFLLAGLVISGLVITNTEAWLGKKEIARHIKQELPTESKESKENEAARSMAGDNKLFAATKQISNDVNNLASTVANENRSQSFSGTKIISYPKEKLHQAPASKSKTKGSVKTNVVAAIAGEMEAGKEVGTVTADEVNIAAGPKLENNIASATKIDIVPVEKNQQPLIAKAETQEKGAKMPAAENKKGQKKIRKWQLGLTFSGGISSTGNKYLSNPLYANDVTATPGGALADSTAAYRPSKTNSGFSFAAGVALSRNISKSFSVYAGLQYVQMNTSVKTGFPSRQSNGVNFESFSYGSEKNYNNRYHFISLPVGFSAIIFPIGQSDVCVNAGASFSKLLSTNAVNFNASQRIYYNDENLFNKTQIGLNASIAFNLASRNKPALYVGPEFYYGLKPLASSGIYTGAHPVFIGLRLQKNLW